MTVLITADELAAALASPAPPKLLDVRWRLDRPDGHPAFLEGHIPGAVYVDLDHELAEHGAPEDGRHPLPQTARLQDAARRWGLNDGDTVVVYDDLKSLSAGRAWWLLRDAGVEVLVLDGSLRAWTASGRALETGEVTPEPGTITLGSGQLARLSVDEAAALPGHGLLLDARAGERYRGETEPIDPRAGHIPGAKTAPTTEHVDADGRFLDAAALRARFAALGASPGQTVGVYCGSGVTAAHAAIALTIAGYEPALYPGSWSQWSNLPRPVAVGAEPGEAAGGASGEASGEASA